MILSSIRYKLFIKFYIKKAISKFNNVQHSSKKNVLLYMINNYINFIISFLISDKEKKRIKQLKYSCYMLIMKNICLFLLNFIFK